MHCKQPNGYLIVRNHNFTNIRTRIHKNTAFPYL
jgi:hypothetical protein